jgi:hypothetical protein
MVAVDGVMAATTGDGDMIQLKRIQNTDQTLKLIQDNVQNAINQLSASPFIGGNLLTNVNLVASQDNLVSHGLQRLPQIYVVTGLNVDSVIWNPASASLGNQPSNSVYLNLWCSSSCTISLWVN